VSESPAVSATPEEPAAGGLLAWENLGARTPGSAFVQTLKELLFNQRRFFEKMATTGGLREPLTFFWILLSAVIAMSFPLALSHFALTAPDPAEVGSDVYNLHLLAPRATGFLTVLMPLSLCVGGMITVIQGTVFHLGARFFGARNWEGSVSIWCYARSAALAPIAAAEALACAISVLAYLLTVAWPGATAASASVVHWSLLILGGAAVLCSLVLFFSAVVNGCLRSFGLTPEVGIAAALAGVLLVVAVAAFVVLGFYRWGLTGGMITTGGSTLMMLALALTHHFAARGVGARPPRSDPSSVE